MFAGRIRRIATHRDPSRLREQALKDLPLERRRQAQVNRWRQVVDQVLNQPFTGPALAMTAGAATGMPTLQRRGDRALCLSAYPLSTTTSALFRATVQLRPSGCSGRTVASGPVYLPGALVRCTDRPEWQVPAASVGSSATSQLRGSRSRHAGGDRGVRFEAAGAAGMVSGGRGTSALSHRAVCLDTAAGPSLLVTEAREFGRGFCGRSPACSFAGTTPSCLLRQRPRVTDLAGRPGRQRQPLAVPSLGSGSATGYPAPASWHSSTSRMASGPAT